MATRLDKRQSEQTRQKIKTSQLVNRLSAFALSEEDPQTGRPVEMTPAQVKAATTLLDRVMPRLQSIEGDLGLTNMTHEQRLKQLEAEAAVAETATRNDDEAGDA